MRYASLRQGLVGCWCPSVSGPFGYRLPDLSGYGNHGTLTNMDPGTDWVASGGKGALDFDGSNDYLDARNSPALGTGEFSMCLWANIRSASFKTVGGTYNGFAGFYISNNVNADGKFYFYNGSAYVGATNVSDGKWRSLLIIRRQEQIRIYVNGVLDNIPSSNTTSISSLPMYFGSIPNPNYNINCQLDDIRIYNRALSESEIRLLASGRGVGLIPERQRNRYSAPAPTSRNRSSRFLSFPA